MFEVTRKEVKELIIAFIVISFCFAISTVRFDIHGIVSILPIVMVGVGAGFILHEVGHKLVAMKYGCLAEFEIWPLGLVIAFATSLIGFVYAAPGAVQTYADDITDEINGKISIAGPMTNIVLGIVFIAIAALIYPLTLYSKTAQLLYLIGTVGFSVNSFLAAFNLLPIGISDGTKVLKWNIRIWILTLAVAGTMMIISMTIGAENLVKLIVEMYLPS